MQNDTKKTCCFFGHRDRVYNEPDVFVILLDKVKELIKKGYNEFLFGGYGMFDALAHKAVKSFKEGYPYLKSVYVLAYLRNNFDRDYLNNMYDEIVYPEIEEKPKRFAIAYRNKKIIDDSEVCIFYVDRSYGGAYKAMQYAKRKKKEFINIIDFKV